MYFFFRQRFSGAKRRRPIGLLLILLSVLGGLNAQTNTFPTSGNAGIGTLSPANTLEVTGSTGGNISVEIKNTGSGRGALILDSGSTSTTPITFRSGGVDKWTVQQTGSSNYLGIYDETAAAYRMVIEPTYGRVGIHTLSPDAQLHVGGPMVTSSSSDSNHYHNVLSYYLGGGAQTGTLKLVMPQSWSSTMLQIVIRGYQYELTGGAWEVRIGGYNYSGGYWVYPSAEISGHAPFDQVRLAHDGSKNVILLGTTSTHWSYGIVEISDVVTSFGNISGWADGWTAALLTSESGISGAVAPAIDIYTAGNGNVGVGTTNATHRLSIDSGTSSNTFRAHAAGDFIFALAGDGTAGSNVDLFSIRNNNTGAVHLNTANSARLALGASDGSNAGGTVETMTITAAGNVGIGTINPTQKLAVNGTIRAKEVIVDTGWSDYVFSKSYQLQPLAEVKAHIEKEGHLPGIPSAVEVTRHGVSVGEAQAAMLAKIEELTLHAIAQEEELAKQRALLVALQQQNRVLIAHLKP